MRILIVEGNTEALMTRNEQAGRPLAWQTWETAIRLHAPDATIEVTFPYSGARDGKHAPVSDFDAYVLTGSGVSWNAMDERALPFLRRIEPMLASGKPVLGRMLGPADRRCRTWRQGRREPEGQRSRHCPPGVDVGGDVAPGLCRIAPQLCIANLAPRPCHATARWRGRAWPTAP